MTATNILHLQRVQNDIRIGDECAGYRHLCRLAFVVSDGDVVQRLTLRPQTLCIGHIDTLDAQLAVIVLEHRVGEVVATVNQSDDDTLARIGLGQVFLTFGLALMCLVYV